MTPSPTKVFFTQIPTGRIARHIAVFFVAVALLSSSKIMAQGGPPQGDTNTLCTCSFSDTNSWSSDLGYAARSWSNVVVTDEGDSGAGYAPLIDATAPAWISWNLIEPSSGTTNLTLNLGSIFLWFSPDWSGTNNGGQGPGVYGRLLEVGSADGTNGYFGLYVDPAGCNLLFASGDDQGNAETYLTAPIYWNSNDWHYLVLTYSSTNSAIYIDGSLVSNGPGVAYLPDQQAITNGFFLGSSGDSATTGSTNQARGVFDDLWTYNHVVSSDVVTAQWGSSDSGFIINPNNLVHYTAPQFISSASSYITNTPVFRAISGPGYLQYIGGAANWSASTNVWMTNIVAKLGSNSLTTITFSVGGGINDGSLYDVFGTGALEGKSITNSTWSWLGQVQAACRYSISGIPNTESYFILGNPQDSDIDGLSDAYEILISHTDPYKTDTAGSGFADWFWAVYYGGSSSANPYTFCANGDGWTLADCYHYGWNPNTWHTPPPARNVTAQLDSSQANVIINWQAAGGSPTNYTVMQYVNWESAEYPIGSVNTATFTFATPVTFYDDGVSDLYQYCVRANYADGSYADSPLTPPIGGGALNCAINLVRGPGGALYVAIGPMPPDLTKVRVAFEDAYDSQIHQYVPGGWFDIPASSFTNGLARVPLDQNPDSYVYDWFDVQCFGANGAMAQPSYFLLWLNSDTASESIFHFADARRHIRENLKFLLSSATITRPFSYAAGVGAYWLNTQYPLDGYARMASPTDYEYYGFRLYDPNAQRSWTVETQPVRDNFTFRNFLFDTQIWTSVVSNAFSLDDQQYPFRVLLNLASNYTGWGSESPLPLALSNAAPQWSYYFGKTPGPDALGAEAGFELDANQNPVVGQALYNCYGLPLRSLRVDLTGAYYLPGEALPASRSSPATYYFPRFDLPKLKTVDIYFASPTPYLNYQGPPSPYSGVAPLPGSPSFSTSLSSQLIIASVGQPLVVSLWLKQQLTNGLYGDRFAYEEQYFDTAYQIDSGGDPTTNQTGLLSPYGEFLATDTGTEALLTVPDIDTGDTAAAVVRVISLSTDGNHDGTLDTSYSGSDFTSPQHPFRFWINDDIDSGDEGGTGIPGQLEQGDGVTPFVVPWGVTMDGTPFNRRAWKVHGVRDLVDWFPVYVNIGSLFQETPYGPSISLTDTNYHFRLRQADEALRFIYTDLGPTNFMSFLRSTNVAYSLLDAEGATINASGVDLTNTFLQSIASGGGIILVEASASTTEPLVLEVWQNTNLLAQTSLYLSISAVEDMFRHKNLMPASIGPGDRLVGSQVWNEPDTINRNVVFVHGYNVTPEQARGWGADLFKRMYWSGSHARFYAITWNGAETQDIASGLLTPDYHVNVVNAFDTAPQLNTFLSGLSGETVLAAHSLGNMLALSVINDRTNQTVSKYFMLNAAVPMEAVDPPPNTEPFMFHSAWSEYDQRLFSSCWYALFPTNDARYSLTWSNRFVNLGNVDVYNFYSSGEEVLRDNENDAPLSMLGAAGLLVDYFKTNAPFASYAWVWQEKAKGVAPLDTVLGSTHGGWKFNTNYDSGGLHLSPTSAASLPNPQLCTNSFFDFTSPDYIYDAALYGPVGDTNAQVHALQWRSHILAEAIPALSWAVGAHHLQRLAPDGSPDKNFDMQGLFENGWPAKRPQTSVGASAKGEWHHSDFRQAAYTFTYKLFKELVGVGNLE